MPFELPSKFGFTMTGYRSAFGWSWRGVLDELPARRRDAVLGEHELRELLVERERERVGVGAGVRHAELVEERREERLPEPPAPPLGGVEDEVRAVGLEARDGARGRAGDLDPLDAVAEPLDGAGERVDGLAGVELGLLLGVGEAEVVRERDAHRRRLLGPRVSGREALRPRCAWPPAVAAARRARGGTRRGGRGGEIGRDRLALRQHLPVDHLGVGEDVADPDAEPVRVDHVRLERDDRHARDEQHGPEERHRVEDRDERERRVAEHRLAVPRRRAPRDDHGPDAEDLLADRLPGEEPVRDEQVERREERPHLRRRLGEDEREREVGEPREGAERQVRLGVRAPLSPRVAHLATSPRRARAPARRTGTPSRAGATPRA